MNEAQQKRMDEVTHEIREILRVVSSIRNFGTGTAYNEFVAQILSLVYIADPDQKYPEFLTLAGLTEMELVNATRKSLTDNGFIKVIKEGE